MYKINLFMILCIYMGVFFPPVLAKNRKKYANMLENREKHRGNYIVSTKKCEKNQIYHEKWLLYFMHRNSIIPTIK